MVSKCIDSGAAASTVDEVDDTDVFHPQLLAKPVSDWKDKHCPSIHDIPSCIG